MKYLVTLLYAIIFVTNASAQNSVTIRGKGIDLPDGDSVNIAVYNYNVKGNDKRLERVIRTPIRNRQFSQMIERVESVTQLTIEVSSNSKTNFIDYLVRPGEDILFNFNKDNVLISGRDSESFSLQYQLRKSFMETKMPPLKPQYFAQYYAKLDSISNKQSEIIESRKATLKREDYLLLKTIAKLAPLSSAMYVFDYLGGVNCRDSIVKHVYETALKEKVSHAVMNGIVTSDYIDLLNIQYQADSCDLENKRFAATKFIKYIHDNFSAELRNRVLVQFLMKKHDLVGVTSTQLADFSKEIKDPTLSSIVSEFALKVSTGAKAYNFTLPDVNGKTVKLNDFSGKVIVLDFWFTGCPGCRDLAPHLKDIEGLMSRTDVKFLSISIDKNMSIWKKSIEQGLYTTSTAINLNAGQSPAGSTVINEYKVYSYPTLYIINKSGQIVNVNISPREDGGKEFLKQLNSLL